MHPDDPMVEQHDGTFVSQADLVAAVMGGACAPAPELLDASGHKPAKDVQLLGPGGMPIDSRLQHGLHTGDAGDDPRLILPDSENDELARLPVDEVMAQIYAAEQALEAEYQAQEHPYPQIESLIPWELAPACTWMLTLRWREDRALEAYWMLGDTRMPAHELADADMEFFYACQQLPGHDDPKQTETVAFLRMYGNRPASPWDYDFARWWFTWFQETQLEQKGITLLAPEKDVSRIKLHAHSLAVAIRIELVIMEKNLQRPELINEAA